MCCQDLSLALLSAVGAPPSEQNPELSRSSGSYGETCRAEQVPKDARLLLL